MTHRITGISCALVAWVWCASPAAVLGQCPNPTARIVSIDSQVEYKAASAVAFVPASPNLDVCGGDAVRTGERSRATIVFVDNTRMVIDQNTEWIVREPAQQGRTLIDLIKGAILFFTRQPRSLDIRTPFVNAAVEGTEFLVRVEKDRTLVTVFEGRVALTNPLGDLILVGNESGAAIEGRAPERRVVARPRDAVQWALYYPPVLEGDSFEQLDKIPAAERDARFHVRRASLLLGVGRADEARADLEQAIALDPNVGDAYALRAVIAVALNDRVNALANGREAVKRSPTSAASRIALSYALQSDFEIEAARDELLQAVKDQPGDARAWARLAELWLSLGYPGRAKDAAERAVSLAPDQGRAHTVLGFAALARVDIAGAQAAFEKAIALEPGSPLARLGRGLARIRKGQLAEGRREIEIAVLLNPEDPIARNYLGKAYFDERREPQSGAQFERAKQIDPRDPTAYFYDAIRKQTLNRPVEALEDLERSIALNDNRAVYRSRLLLDQDLAARSAGLGRIYRDLGFEQLAPVEGWKSLDADPGDYSGHRLLADTYSALPRHEVARVSELLQALLLQPINITPVPVGLSEPSLFILEGAGPSESAFNEFNPLFNRNRLAVQASGTVGQESIFGDEVTVSGVWNRLSFSAGQFHYGTDGLRENNEQDRDLYNAFVQAQLSPATSVQGEFRSDRTSSGDLFINFDPTDFSPDRAVRQDTSTARFGGRHEFNKNSLLIGSFYWQSQDFSFSETTVLGDVTAREMTLRDTHGVTAEIRHLYRARRFSLTSGVGHFQSERKRDETLEVVLPEPLPSFTESSQFTDNPAQTNAYVYSLVDLPKHVTLTMGASADFYRREFLRRNQFNPKLGIVWQPLFSTTLRASVVRTLNRTVVSSQTIEPTMVAGFSQLFADGEAEEARQYGVGVDHKFSDVLFGGAEYTRRNLYLPVEFVDESVRTVQWFPRTDQFWRSYLYWAPERYVSLSAEYFVEDFDHTEFSGDEAFLDVETRRFALGGRYFHESGAIAHLKAAYVSQDGDFLIRGFPTAGKDSFWVVDAAVGYRLPKRFGRLMFEVKNVFDEGFSFQDSDPGNPRIRPGRLAVFRFIVGV